MKPDNVGFDVRGDVKLFDFGLAREIPTNEQSKTTRSTVDENLYKLTGLVGSRRYMAPEVVRCCPYNGTCDVYSFAILLWEMLSTKTPFAGYDKTVHNIRVVMNDERPPKTGILAVDLLLQECWGKDISKRPSFKRICSVLCDAAESFSLINKGISRSELMMNKSSASLQNSSFLVGVK